MSNTEITINPKHTISAFQNKSFQLHSELVLKDAYILQLQEELEALKVKPSDDALQAKANELYNSNLVKDELISKLTAELKTYKDEK